MWEDKFSPINFEVVLGAFFFKQKKSYSDSCRDFDGFVLYELPQD